MYYNCQNEAAFRKCSGRSLKVARLLRPKKKKLLKPSSKTNWAAQRALAGWQTLEVGKAREGCQRIAASLAPAEFLPARDSLVHLEAQF